MAIAMIYTGRHSEWATRLLVCAPMVTELYDIISAMRTTLELDDSLMDALMARSKGKSKTKAVETAITDYLRRDAARGIRRLRGKITFEDPDYWRKSRQAELSQR
jgi:Arc/MetJ family transcription regulator